MGRGLDWLQRNLVWAVPGFMVLGLLGGLLGDASVLKGAIIPLTFLMVYPMMVNLQVREVFSPGGGRLQAVTQGINFLVVPFVAVLLGRIFFSDRPLIALGLLLTALLPTSGMTISWTGLAKGNVSAAIKMTVVGLILGSIATPFYAKVLMGAVVTIPLKAIFQQIVAIVFLPMVLGLLTRALLIRFLGASKYHKSLKAKFPPFSTLGVLGIVAVAMALKARDIGAHPWALLTFLLPLALLYGSNFFISTWVAKVWFNRADGIALVYGTVMRNLSIALAIAMTSFGPEAGAEIALIIALAYVIQVQAAAWYVRWSDRIFGPIPTDLQGLDLSPAPR